MNIYDFVILCHLSKIDRSTSGTFAPRLGFALPATDVMVSPDGSLVVALSRVDGRFVAQRGQTCIVGRVDIPLTAEQLETLKCD